MSLLTLVIQVGIHANFKILVIKMSLLTLVIQVGIHTNFKILGIKSHC